MIYKENCFPISSEIRPFFQTSQVREPLVNRLLESIGLV